eukprot:7028402-Alexandrium_andersonii.AAC.1
MDVRGPRRGCTAPGTAADAPVGTTACATTSALSRTSVGAREKAMGGECCSSQACVVRMKGGHDFPK